jgi:hypothetical protein
MPKHKHDTKAHVVAVNMGYGHQRAAHPLRELAYRNAIIDANTYAGIPAKDKAVWEDSRKAYEFISRFKKVPLIGKAAFDLFDKFQAIPAFYPKRDLSAPSIQVRSFYSLIKRKKWGKHLIDKLAKNPLPIVTTFFMTAFMAEIWDYPGEIYCLGTDTDLSRAWAPLRPKESRIKYFAPNYRAEARLKMYGIRPKNLFVTGFPLPDKLVGGDKETVVKKNLGKRLLNLDPKKVYIKRYHESICKHIDKCNFPKKIDHPLTVTFAVGGAGAQRELGIEIVTSLKQKIEQHEIRVNLVAGTHSDVNNYFRKEILALGLKKELGKYVRIVFDKKKYEYFHAFDKALKETDILWTKPSELSFYTALGLPIIMSSPIGSQEKFNQKWLKTIGSGIDQEDPKYTHQWLFDWINSGWFAEAAMQGFVEASTSGVENIKKVLAHKEQEVHQIKKILQY